MASLSTAVAVMVAAYGFASSMDHFTATPRLWGIDFELGAGNPFSGTRFQDTALPALRQDPGIRDLSAGNLQQTVSLEGPGGEAQAAAWGLAVVKGDPVTTTMLDGRWPEQADEIALGRQTLRDLGVGLDETVTVRVAGTAEDMSVVGVPVFPDFGFGPGLGQGVGMTMDGLHGFFPDAALNLAIGRYEPGADPAAVAARVNPMLKPLDAEVQPQVLQGLGETLQSAVRARALPLQLSGLFALAAFATLVHVLVSSVRRRRRDLAILRTLGLRRRQIAATIAWQAATLCGVALTFGVPLGLLLGRLGWAAFAYQLGVVSEPVPALRAALLAIPAMLGLAILVSVGPALFARRTRPAAVLRAE